MLRRRQSDIRSIRPRSRSEIWSWLHAASRARSCWRIAATLSEHARNAAGPQVVHRASLAGGRFTGAYRPAEASNLAPALRWAMPRSTRWAAPHDGSPAVRS